jgi:hypothetical protein
LPIRAGRRFPVHSPNEIARDRARIQFDRGSAGVSVANSRPDNKDGSTSNHFMSLHLTRWMSPGGRYNSLTVGLIIADAQTIRYATSAKSLRLGGDLSYRHLTCLCLLPDASSLAPQKKLQAKNPVHAVALALQQRLI